MKIETTLDRICISKIVCSFLFLLHISYNVSYLDTLVHYLRLYAL
jgi:hypothetical protein